MHTSTLVAEKRLIQELAREYQDKGYEVAVEPEAKQLPAALADFRPDLLVRRGEDVIVVEVKGRGSLGDPKLQELAKTVREQPGWRFELVLLKPKSESRSDAVERRRGGGRSGRGRGHVERRLCRGGAAARLVCRRGNVAAAGG